MFGEDVVGTIAGPADRGLDAGHRVLGREVWTPARMMDEPGVPNGPPLMERVLQGVEDEADMRCPARPPAHASPRKSVDGEGHGDEADPAPPHT